MGRFINGTYVTDRELDALAKAQASRPKTPPAGFATHAAVLAHVGEMKMQFEQDEFRKKNPGAIEAAQIASQHPLHGKSFKEIMEAPTNLTAEFRRDYPREFEAAKAAAQK